MRRRARSPTLFPYTTLFRSLYVQDAWKITPRLTLNYGVRWEPWFPISSKEGLFMRFDKSLFDQNVHSTVHVNAPAGLVFPGEDRKSTRLNSSHANISYAVFC